LVADTEINEFEPQGKPLGCHGKTVLADIRRWTADAGRCEAGFAHIREEFSGAAERRYLDLRDAWIHLSKVRYGLYCRRRCAQSQCPLWVVSDLRRLSFQFPLSGSKSHWPAIDRWPIEKPAIDLPDSALLSVMLTSWRADATQLTHFAHTGSAISTLKKQRAARLRQRDRVDI